MLKRVKLKKVKKYRLVVPNYVRLSFYMFPIGDHLLGAELTEQDVDIIKNINTYNISSLVDTVEYVDEGDLYSLMVEGAIKERNTGADTGIYNYKPVSINKNFSVDLSKFIGENFINEIEDSVKPYRDDEKMFSNCILAEPDKNGGEYCKVIKTFKGYLQVTLEKFSFIRNCDCDSDISIVYVPQSYVQKYQLRNGDELVCTCKEDKGVMVLTSLFTINKISCFNWDAKRPWFNSLKFDKVANIKPAGQLTQSVVTKFNLYKGDNMFLYLNKTCQKDKVTPSLISELEDMFDYIIYLNPKYSPMYQIDNCHKVVKFCTPINAELKHQQNLILLGANYTKRLVELGNSVALIVDDAESIMELETEIDLPICKTVYSCALNTTNGYSNSFTVVSLKNRTIKSIKLNKILKSAETIGVLFDNNEIDTFNSYRV